MSLPPLHNQPRVFEVFDPSVNQHALMVLMATDTPQRFPDKPWGTPIEHLDIAPKSKEKYAGYTLVGFEPVRGGSDLFWIFQNLTDSPQWDTVTNSRDNLTPRKFTGLLTQTKIEQEVVPGTAPSTLTGNLVRSSVERQKNTGKSLRIEITEVLATGASLGGKINYVERTLGTTTESLVVDGTAADSGLLVVDSRVVPQGDGKSVKDSTTVASWPIHTGSRWDEELGTNILFTEQFIAVNTYLDSPFTDVSIVNEHRNLRHTEVVPTEAFEAYHKIYPHNVELNDLPRELIGIHIVWNAQYSIGTQDFAFAKTASGRSWSLSTSADDQASSSASIMAEVQPHFRDIASNNLPGERHEFYLPEPVTEADILAALDASRWPVFKPEIHTVTASGQSIRISVSAQAWLGGRVDDNAVVEQGWSKGTSDDFSVGLNHNSIQLPACIHGAIAFTGGTNQSQLVSATALIGMTNTLIGTVTSTRTKTGTAFGTVYPSSLGPTGTVTAIPTDGLYLMGTPTVGRPRMGYCAITAVVFDAAVLA